VNFHLITPTYEKKASVSWVELNSSAGNFVVQLGHKPMFLILDPEKELIFCLTTGKKETVVVGEGIAHITRDSAKVIILPQKKSEK